MIRDWATAILLVIGCGLVLVAALGVSRMPDVLSRMHAAGVANTLGALFALAGVIVAFADLAVVARALLITAFLFVTMPVGSHMLGRAAHMKGERTSIRPDGDSLAWDVDKDGD